jgi:hypothetical protein
VIASIGLVIGVLICRVIVIDGRRIVVIDRIIGRVIDRPRVLILIPVIGIIVPIIIAASVHLIGITAVVIRVGRLVCLRMRERRAKHNDGAKEDACTG